jgi:hypothetical protein
MKIASTAVAVDVPPAVPAQVGAGEAVPEVSAQALAEALDPQLVTRLAAQARAQGVSLLGRDGLLQQLTKRFLEASLEAEMDEHLGYGKHDAAGRNGANSRNCPLPLGEAAAFLGVWRRGLTEIRRWLAGAEGELASTLRALL